MSLGVDRSCEIFSVEGGLFDVLKNVPKFIDVRKKKDDSGEISKLCEKERKLLGGIISDEEDLCKLDIKERDKNFINSLNKGNYIKNLNKKKKNCNKGCNDLFDEDIIKGRGNIKEFRKVRGRVNKNRYDVIKQIIENNMDNCALVNKKEKKRRKEMREYEKERSPVDKLMAKIYEKNKDDNFNPLEVNRVPLDKFKILEDKYIEEIKTEEEIKRNDKNILGDIINNCIDFWLNIDNMYREEYNKIKKKTG